MVYLSSSEEWQRQSTLLLHARPSTTRITTKYKIPNLQEPRFQKSRKRRRIGNDDGAAKQDDPPSDASRIPRASLILKTYDPQSGVCLKFKTDRAAEVGRLITGLGRVGKHMAALPQKDQDATMEDAQTNDAKNTQHVVSMDAAGAASVEAKGVPTGPSGGGKKKKKGKK